MGGANSILRIVRRQSQSRVVQTHFQISISYLAASGRRAQSKVTRALVSRLFAGAVTLGPGNTSVSGGAPPHPTIVLATDWLMRTPQFS